MSDSSTDNCLYMVYKDYTKEKEILNKDYTKEILKIKNEKTTRIEKWEKKFALVKTFIEKNKFFPYGFHTTLRCNEDGNTNNDYRFKKLSILRCNFIRSDNKVCGNHISTKYKVKNDPFKCKTHLQRCPNCIDWIDSYGGNKKYDGYCARCFKRLFPDDPRTLIIREHSKEIRVRNAITKHSEINPAFKGFIHDRPLWTGNCDCTHRRRIDHRKLIGNTILAIETDENAHKNYDKTDEKLRYDDLYMIHSGKWIFIRFNPDITEIYKTKLEDRLSVLLSIIEEQAQRIINEENTELLEIIYLYY